MTHQRERMKVPWGIEGPELVCGGFWWSSHDKQCYHDTILSLFSKRLRDHTSRASSPSTRTTRVTLGISCGRGKSKLFWVPIVVVEFLLGGLLSLGISSSGLESFVFYVQFYCVGVLPLFQWVFLPGLESRLIPLLVGLRVALSPDCRYMRHRYHHSLDLMSDIIWEFCSLQWVMIDGPLSSCLLSHPQGEPLIDVPAVHTLIYWIGFWSQYYPGGLQFHPLAAVPRARNESHALICWLGVHCHPMWEVTPHGVIHRPSLHWDSSFSFLYIQQGFRYGHFILRCCFFCGIWRRVYCLCFLLEVLWFQVLHSSL